MVKTGFGLDIHQLKKGRKCILGGIEIESELGPDGHSDADVVIHSLIDGILGALSLGDIGQWFPDSDEKYKNIDSKILLKEVCQTLKLSNYKIDHIDITIITEVPRIDKHKSKMIIKLSDILEVDMSKINIKATTTEKLGFIGAEEGIACMSVVNLVREDENALTDELLTDLSAQSVAYLGDAVLELYVRKHLLAKGINKGNKLHKRALDYVSANSQADIVRNIMEDFTAEEMRIFKWGRNSSGGCVPKNTDVREYRYSTGLEALLGYLYIKKDIERLEEIIAFILEN
ncbi:MAG: 2-C-methyl-D-erythritol 2,4-cyclodiphosphate synthase [Clostridia bacterium]